MERISRIGLAVAGVSPAAGGAVASMLVLVLRPLAGTPALR